MPSPSPQKKNAFQCYLGVNYDTLFWSPSGSWTDLEGLLVTNLSISEDNLTWVMDLEEEVYFQNGNNLNAASVVGTFDYYIENAIGSALNSVESYEATGEYQVTLHLSGPNPDLMSLLAGGGIGIFDHTCYEELGFIADAAIGASSGPYYIDSYAIGDSITLKAVENHWNPDRQAHIETVNMKIILNVETQYNAVASGELDFASLSTYSAYELLVDSPDHVIFSYAGKVSCIYYNLDGFCEYLENAAVREALTLMIDSEQVMLANTGGYGTVGSNALNLVFTDYEHDRTYDPEAGLAILEAEGIDPTDIELTAVTSGMSSAAFGNIQSQFMEYGITLNFVESDMNVVQTQGIAGEWDLMDTTGGLGSLPFYSSPLSTAWSSSAVTAAVTGEFKETIAAMTDETLIQPEIEDAYAMMAEICQILDENYLYMCNWTGTGWACFSTRIANPVLCFGTGDWRVYDSWIAE